MTLFTPPVGMQLCPPLVKLPARVLCCRTHLSGLNGQQHDERVDLLTEQRPHDLDAVPDRGVLLLPLDLHHLVAQELHDLNHILHGA